MNDKISQFRNKDDAPMYISFRNKWRVIIKGKPHYFEEYADALKKWNENNDQ